MKIDLRLPHCILSSPTLTSIFSTVHHISLFYYLICLSLSLSLFIAQFLLFSHRNIFKISLTSITMSPSATHKHVTHRNAKNKTIIIMITMTAKRKKKDGFCHMCISSYFTCISHSSLLHIRKYRPVIITSLCYFTKEIPLFTHSKQDSLSSITLSSA